MKLNHNLRGEWISINNSVGCIYILKNNYEHRYSVHSPEFQLSSSDTLESFLYVRGAPTGGVNKYLVSQPLYSKWAAPKPSDGF